MCLSKRPIFWVEQVQSVYRVASSKGGGSKMTELLKVSRMKLEIRGEVSSDLLEDIFAKARGEKRASMTYYYDNSKGATVVHLYPVRIVDEFANVVIEDRALSEIWRSLIYFDKTSLPITDYGKFIQDEFYPFRKEKLEMIVVLVPYAKRNGSCRFELIVGDMKRVYDPTGKIPKQFLTQYASVEERAEMLQLAKEWIFDSFEEYVSTADSNICPAARDMDEISMAMAESLSGI